jgi:hypothetical protein
MFGQSTGALSGQESGTSNGKRKKKPDHLLEEPDSQTG